MVPVVSTAHPRMICAAGHLLSPSRSREPTNSVTCDIFSGLDGIVLEEKPLEGWKKFVTFFAGPSVHVSIHSELPLACYLKQQ